MSGLVVLIQNWDGQVVEEVVHRRTALLNRWMIVMTRLGDGWAWLVLGFAVVIFDSRHAAQAIAPMAFGLLLDIPVYSVLKHAISRPRPYQQCDSVSCIAAPPDRFSFPSGHTSVAFSVLVTAGACYGWLVLPLALLALLIGASRVYLGAHYPSDVVAGAVLGSVCGAAALRF